MRPTYLTANSVSAIPQASSPLRAARPCSKSRSLLLRLCAHEDAPIPGCELNFRRRWLRVFRARCDHSVTPRSRIAARSRPETTSLAIRRAFLSQRRAHAYSVARIASPKGITTNAGPGKTSRAIPISSTVAPTTDTIARLTNLISSTFQRPNKRFIDELDRITLRNQSRTALRKRSRKGTCADFNLRLATSSEKKHA